MQLGHTILYVPDVPATMGMANRWVEPVGKNRPGVGFLSTLSLMASSRSGARCTPLMTACFKPRTNPVAFSEVQGCKY